VSEEPLLSLRQVAELLGRPVSTVRYYRDAFLDHVPVVGMGRRRRYPPPAVAVLRTIAQGFAAGESRQHILNGLDGGGDHGAAWRDAGRHGGHGQSEVTGVELLAAIADGRREQREALLQMAGEIVRLTGVLEGHERMLTALAASTGTPAEPPALAGGVQPLAALGRGSAAAEPAAAAGGGLPAAEMEHLRAELEAERQLVERLREAKVKLEHRVVDAESELEERRRRRASVLERILGPAERG